MDVNLDDYQDPRGCPAERPVLAHMGERTRALHEAVDAHGRRAGVPYLNPTDPSLQRDLLGSDGVLSWQARKAALTAEGTECWSSLPHLYGRYGTETTRALVAEVRRLEGARAAVVTDCGMQAVALVADVLMTPGAHAVSMRQVYNKTRQVLERLAARVGGAVTVVDDGDHEALRAAIRPETRLVFCETFTNPLTRAQDPDALVALVRDARRVAPELRLVVDDTIATPWAFRRPLLASGVDVVVASGTKSLGGHDRDLWGLIATDDVGVANAVMDLIALRGGILDWRRARAILDGLPAAAELAARRCESAERVAAFLADHPAVEQVWHPSLPDHPDAAIIRRHYVRHGSLLSFRVRGADEEAHRHLADVLATTRVVRFALSFDGLVTKVNHHRSVSETYTPEELLRRNGIDRLIRLAVGTEDAADIIAALNWTLHHGPSLSRGDVAEWQAARARELGIAEG